MRRRPRAAGSPPRRPGCRCCRERGVAAEQFEEPVQLALRVVEPAGAGPPVRAAEDRLVAVGVARPGAARRRAGRAPRPTDFDERVGARAGRSGPGPCSSQPRRTAGRGHAGRVTQPPGTLPSSGDGAGSAGCGVTVDLPSGSSAPVRAPVRGRRPGADAGEPIRVRPSPPGRAVGCAFYHWGSWGGPFARYLPHRVHATAWPDARLTATKPGPRSASANSARTPSSRTGRRSVNLSSAARRRPVYLRVAGRLRQRWPCVLVKNGACLTFTTMRTAGRRSRLDVAGHLARPAAAPPRAPVPVLDVLLEGGLAAARARHVGLGRDLGRAPAARGLHQPRPDRRPELAGSTSRSAEASSATVSIPIAQPALGLRADAPDGRVAGRPSRRPGRVRSAGRRRPAWRTRSPASPGACSPRCRPSSRAASPPDLAGSPRPPPPGRPSRRPRTPRPSPAPRPRRQARAASP